MFKRIISVLLVSTVLCPALICSCSDESEEYAEVSVTSVSEETDESAVDSLEARKSVSDKLPEKDYEGAVFNTVSQTWTITDAFVEKETGDVIEDAVYNRNRSVEERFNVNIACVQGNYEENNAYVNKTVLAGEDSVTLFFGQAYYSGGLVLNGLMNDWSDIPFVDFTNEWWAESTIKDLTYNGRCYSAIGDICLSAMYASYCMFYDKEKADSYGIGDLYKIVADGSWTIDFLAHSVKDIYNDLNGDSKRGFDDYYGFVSDAQTNFNAFQWAFDNPIIKKGDDGSPQIVFRTEKISSIIEKLRDLSFNNNGVMISTDYVSPQYNTAEGLSRDMFSKGLCTIANGYISMSVTHFRDLKSDYGIIPMPKWNEEQEEYKTFVDGYHAVALVPITVRDTEMAGIVTEALCAESWRVAVPAYYDVALKVKGARDEESLEMLDLIMKGRTFDFGYIYNMSKGAPVLSLFIKDKNLEFESYYASIKDSMTAFYNGVFEMFYNEDF